MRNTIRFALPALLLAACQPAPKPLSPADETAIRASVTAFQTAANANDVNAMAATSAEDGSVYPNGMPAANGMAAIKKLWTDMQAQARVSKFTAMPDKISGQGDVAYATGTYHLELITADSSHTALPPEDGKFVEVLWRQADKSWKVVADIWNTNTMPAAPAPPAPAAHRR